MTASPRTLVTLDHGAATIAAGFLARFGERWRLVGAHAAPAVLGAEAILADLVDRIEAADPAVVIELGLGRPGGLADLPRLEVRSSPPRRMAVVAATERAAKPFIDAVREAGWRLTVTTADRDDPLAMADRLLDPEIDWLLVGAGEPPGADERSAIAELAALAGGVATRRPELNVVLAGSMVGQRKHLAVGEERPGEIVSVAVGPGLAEALLNRRVAPDDSRQALVRATATLAEILDRRVELLEVGFDGGLRALAIPGGPGEPATIRSTVAASAGLVPEDPADRLVDGVAGWSAVPLDRLRLADRLAELRLSPWGDPTGDGARIRLAAARAALTRLRVLEPAMLTDPVPDIVVLAGGVWAIAPAPAIALAVADALRRPGATQLVLDHARVLAPLGAIDDPAERRAIVEDLAGDLVTPIAGLVIAGGLRPGRSAGRLRVHGTQSGTEVDLVPGGIELVDLPPGEAATVELLLRDGVQIAGHGRHLAIKIAGGLAGLLVDLRGIPLKLPERIDSRRDVLAVWERALWTGLEA